MKNEKILLNYFPKDGVRMSVFNTSIVARGTNAELLTFAFVLLLVCWGLAQLSKIG